MSDKTPRFVIVELFDDSELPAQAVATEIVVAQSLEDVKSAQPAYDDGFGRFVLVGERRERKS